VHKDCKKNVVENFKVMPQKSPGEINKANPVRGIYNRAGFQTEFLSNTSGKSQLLKRVLSSYEYVVEWAVEKICVLMALGLFLKFSINGAVGLI
jgi:hypothetical protein